MISTCDLAITLNIRRRGWIIYVLRRLHERRLSFTVISKKTKSQPIFRNLGRNHPALRIKILIFQLIYYISE